MSYNGWLYVYANPVNISDPSGLHPLSDDSTSPGDRFSSPSTRFALDWVLRRASVVRKCATLYGIPPELPAGLLAAEIDLDHSLPGRIADGLARLANQIHSNPCFHWSILLPQPWPMRHMRRLQLAGAEAYWNVVSTVDTYKVFGKDLGDTVAGTTNVHHTTYLIVEEYMTDSYGAPMPFGTEKSAYLPWLLTDEGSIEFTARMARMLADYRTGRKSLHWRGELSLIDMAQIWGAWRAGIGEVTCFNGPGQCGFENLKRFQEKSDLGDEARLGYPYFAYFRSYFTAAIV